MYKYITAMININEWKAKFFTTSLAAYTHTLFAHYHMLTTEAHAIIKHQFN